MPEAEIEIVEKHHDRKLDAPSGTALMLAEAIREVRPAAYPVAGRSGHSKRTADGPLIKVTPSASSATIAAGSRSMTITGLTSGTAFFIDCGSMEVLNADKSASLLKDATGAFPTLTPGSNTITGSGWSKLVFDRRQRFL